MNEQQAIRDWFVTWKAATESGWAFETINNMIPQ
jgi:hypothetical protein